MSDAIIIFTITTFFILLGTALPFVQAEFSSTETPAGSAELMDSLDITQSVTTLTAWTVLASVFKMFFWTFGDIPAFLDAALFVPLRILLAFVIGRNIWVGGGG